MAVACHAGVGVRHGTIQSSMVRVNQVNSNDCLDSGLEMSSIE